MQRNKRLSKVMPYFEIISDYKETRGEKRKSIKGQESTKSKVK